MEKSIDTAEQSLMEFLVSDAANECRERMRKCEINCHWYQYHATDSFLSMRASLSAIRPYVNNLI
jgi:hypothetical protein